jgi:hypothetical protein
MEDSNSDSRGSDKHGEEHLPVERTNKTGEHKPTQGEDPSRPDEAEETLPGPASRKISKVDGAEKPNIYPLF